MALEDAVDIAATLRDACSAGGPQQQGVAKAFAAADPTVIAAALRAMERRRTARCAPLVQTAHDNAERTIMPNSLPVRYSPVCLCAVSSFHSEFLRATH